jgi:hypothetical protein
LFERDFLEVLFFFPLWDVSKFGGRMEVMFLTKYLPSHVQIVNQYVEDRKEGGGRIDGGRKRKGGEKGTNRNEEGGKGMQKRYEWKERRRDKERR